MASTVVSLSSTAEKSVTDPSGVGTRKAPPFNLPFNSGITSPIAFAAPVVDGMILMAAARARLKFFPRQIRRIALLQHLNFVTADDNVFVIVTDLAFEFAVH